MKSDIKQSKGSRVDVAVSVTAEEFKPFVDAALREFVANADLPGFRKGKAPAELVRERVGEYALYERAANEAAKKFFLDLADQNNWQPLDQPSIEVTKLAPQNDFEFKVSFTSFPDIALPDYKNLLKPMGSLWHEPQVTPAQVQETMEWLQKSRRTFVDAPHAAQQGNRVTVDFSMTENDQPVPDGAQNDFSFVIGEGRIFPEFEQQVLGMEKAATKTFSATLPKDYWNKTIANKTIAFSVLLKNVQDAQMPELDDEFAKSVGKFETIAALEQSVREGMEHEEKEKEQQKFRMAILEAIDKQATMDVPEALVSREQDLMLHELEHSIEQGGMEWKEYLTHIGKNEEQMKQEFKDQAQKRVRYALIMRAVADKENIEPTNDEVQDEVSRALMQYKTPEEAAKSIDVESLVSYTKNILTNEKVSQFLESLARAAA